MKRHLILVAVAAVAVAGCASQKPMKPTPTPTPVVETKVVKKASYVVKKGDSLWKIASKKKVLGDPFRWPLLFKANRDQIADPDFIEARQDLNFKKSYSKDEIADAVKKAEITPPFEPHEQPRKVLPIQY